jgi:hypothetical protein
MRIRKSVRFKSDLPQAKASSNGVVTLDQSQKL